MTHHALFVVAVEAAPQLLTLIGIVAMLTLPRLPWEPRNPKETP